MAANLLNHCTRGGGRNVFQVRSARELQVANPTEVWYDSRVYTHEEIIRDPTSMLSHMVEGVVQIEGLGHVRHTSDCMDHAEQQVVMS